VLETPPSAVVEPSEDALRPLVGPAASGDRDAMRALLTAVAPVVARAVRRVMGRQHPDVEDVAQQSLAGFVDRLAKFRGESSVSHFAERIALYRALTARRQAGIRRRHVQAVSDVELELSADQSPTPPPEATERVRAAMVEALNALPAAQAEAIALHFLLDHTVAEIATMTEVPYETVRSRLRHGKQELRTRFARDRRLADLRPERRRQDQQQQDQQEERDG
jgi:RNA polymerase sigma-70 factor (ECF subfamily)